MSGCLEKLLYVGLTCLICYQTWYNLGGAYELGGPYLSWTALAYSVGSLLPAIWLSVHACKLAFAKKAED